MQVIFTLSYRCLRSGGKTLMESMYLVKILSIVSMLQNQLLGDTPKATTAYGKTTYLFFRGGRTSLVSERLRIMQAAFGLGKWLGSVSGNKHIINGACGKNNGTVEETHREIAALCCCY